MTSRNARPQRTYDRGPPCGGCRSHGVFTPGGDDVAEQDHPRGRGRHQLPPGAPALPDSDRATRSPRPPAWRRRSRPSFDHPADLVILDLDQGGGTSEVLTKIRRRSTVPVIVCSGRATERDRVSLLNLGADDFLTKPYSFAELEARVRAVLRRGSATPTTTLDHGDLVIDQGTRTVTVGESEVTMTRKEFDLLAFLAAAPGTGLLARGPARAGLGLQRSVAGPVDGHRAHPPGPPQDRDRPGEPALDHDHPGHRLPLLRPRGVAPDLPRCAGRYPAGCWPASR